MPIILTPDPSPSNNQTMVDLLTAALVANPIGVLSISVDGQTVQYTRAAALKELAFWEKRLARENGTRPRAATINLSGGFSRQQ